MEKQHEMDQFIENVAAIVQKGGDERFVTAQVAAALGVLLKSNYELPTKYRVPNKNKYVLYPVYVAPDESFSVASAVWDVGQAAPIHDHRTWGVIGIVQGTEYEVSYVRPTDEEEKPLKELEKSYLYEGDVAVCCTTDQDVHEVSCASSIPCVGLHIYGGNIGKITRYMYEKATGKKKAVVTKWDKVTN